MRFDTNPGEILCQTAAPVVSERQARLRAGDAGNSAALLTPGSEMRGQKPLYHMCDVVVDVFVVQLFPKIEFILENGFV
jgi:hypothetical protein